MIMMIMKGFHYDHYDLDDEVRDEKRPGGETERGVTLSWS